MVGNSVRHFATSNKYKVECDKWYLPYIELVRWLYSHFLAGNSAEFSQTDNSKTIQPRAMYLTSLDSLSSDCESIYEYFSLYV